MTPAKSKNRVQPLHVVILVGIVVVMAIAVLLTARLAAVTAGVGVIGLGLVRVLSPAGQQIKARSTLFDSLFLAVLGVGIIVLAFMADNL